MADEMNNEREAIIRAAVAAMPHTNPMVADDLLGGFTMHTEADDIVAIFQAGRASLAANAGSEPVAWVDSWTNDQWIDLAQRHANADWDSDTPDGYLNAVKALCNDFAAANPSPPEGMVGGWMPIETAPKYTEHGVSQHLLLGYAPDEIHEDGFVSQGYWMEAEEDAPDNMGHDGGWVDVHFDFFRCGRSFGAEAYRSAGTQPTHWMPLPPPPTTSAGSGKGE